MTAAELVRNRFGLDLVVVVRPSQHALSLTVTDRALTEFH